MAHECMICNRPIVLVPTIKYRAARDVTGHSVNYYLCQFTEHVECMLDKRCKDTDELMRRLQNR